MGNKQAEGIVVKAEARFAPGQSPDGGFGFVYNVTITNEGARRAQLLRRHWIITDALGAVREVEGEGVVGQQPVLEPGGSFSYQSSSVIATPVGTMRGTYQMVNESGEVMEAEIPEFVLSAKQFMH